MNLLMCVLSMEVHMINGYKRLLERMKVILVVILLPLKLICLYDSTLDGDDPCGLMATSSCEDKN
jgi:hypothetical protein